MSERYFEKMWKCEYCRTDNLSALRNFKCPNCGSPKPDQEHEYYSTKEVLDEEGLKLAKGTQNWVCKYCGTANIGEREHCSNCSGAKAEGTSFVERELDFNPLEAANQFKGTKYDKSPAEPEPEMPSPASQPPKKKSRFLFYALVGILGFLIGLFVIGKLTTSHYQGIVTQFSWETTRVLERNTLFEEKDDDLPSGAFNVREKEEFSHTEDIYEEQIVTVYETKYIDKGNGSVVEKQVPVEKTEKVKVGEKDIYETVYYYDILRWDEVDRQTLNGQGKTLQYAEIPVNQSLSADKEGAERLKDREEYFVHVEYKKKGKTIEHKFTVSQNVFEQLQIGDKLKIKENFGIPSIEP